jgi:hypothetical protein
MLDIEEEVALKLTHKMGNSCSGVKQIFGIAAVVVELKDERDDEEDDTEV